MSKYNLKYTSKATMTTKDKKFIRTVEYFNADNEKIGSLETLYNPESKNTTKCFDELGNRLDCDVEDAVEGRQFIVDRYEYALQQKSKGFAKKVDLFKLKAAVDRINLINIPQFMEDLKIVVSCLGQI